MKVAIDRDVKWHAKKLEESETRRMEPEEKTGEEAVVGADPPADDEGVAGALPPVGKRKAEHQEDEGEVPDQIGGGSSSFLPGTTTRVRPGGQQPESLGPEPRVASLPGVASGSKVKRSSVIRSEVARTWRRGRNRRQNLLVWARTPFFRLFVKITLLTKGRKEASA